MNKIKKLGHSFYNRSDVVKIARELLGKILVTRIDGQQTAGRIVETEAYEGEGDRASHAYAGRRTKRTEVMYGKPGTAYIYLCYGIHHLFNVVTNKKNVPHAILIRAIEPLEGKETMLWRTNKKQLDYSITKGPGNVAKALGLSVTDTGKNLLGDEIFIAEDGYLLKSVDIIASKRIGVDYAGDDAYLLYRFSIKNNPYVSKNQRKPKT